jgi:hypothetical protein
LTSGEPSGTKGPIDVLTHPGGPRWPWIPALLGPS